MSGTRIGGVKAAETNKKRYPGFYQTIGRLGGQKSRGGGFAADPERAKEAGRKGGLATLQDHCRNGHKYPKGAVPDKRGHKCQTCKMLRRDRYNVKRKGLTA